MNSKGQGPDNLSADSDNIVELHVAKHRNGPVGNSRTFLRQAKSQFQEYRQIHSITMKVPQPIKRFVEIFSELPGVGPRQAMRLAFYFIHRGVAMQSETVRALSELKNIKICKRCFFIYEGPGDICDICSDPTATRL